MKTKGHIIVVLLAFIGLGTAAFGQNPQEEPRYNRAVMRYFNGVDIEQMQANEPEKFDKIKYYFTESFSVEMENCTECTVDYERFFNFDLFNIVEFEESRLTDQEYSFTFKKIYKITLHSEEDVLTSLEGTTPEQVLDIVALRPIPEWKASGNDERDYIDYKRELQVWIRDFPEEYRELTNGTELLKITISEFLSMPVSRREAVMSHQGGYLIIE